MMREYFKSGVDFRDLRLNPTSGMTLIEVLVSLGILSVVVAGMMSFMSSSSREVRALSETLAKLDTEKLLIASLADGSTCTAELANPGLWTTGATSYNLDTTNSGTVANTQINLNNLHASATAASPLLIDKVNPISPSSQTLKASAITFSNFVSTGAANQYTADLTVSLTGSVRQLKPIVLKKLITTAPNVPGSEKITGCLSAGGGSLASYANLPIGAVAGYCVHNSFSNIFGQGAILPSLGGGTTSCSCSSGWSLFVAGNATQGMGANTTYFSCVKTQ